MREVLSPGIEQYRNLFESLASWMRDRLEEKLSEEGRELNGEEEFLLRMEDQADGGSFPAIGDSSSSAFFDQDGKRLESGDEASAMIVFPQIGEEGQNEITFRLFFKGKVDLAREVRGQLINLSTENESEEGVDTLFNLLDETLFFADFDKWECEQLRSPIDLSGNLIVGSPTPSLSREQLDREVAELLASHMRSKGVLTRLSFFVRRLMRRLKQLLGYNTLSPAKKELIERILREQDEYRSSNGDRDSKG